jgi:glutaredoxin-related protein|tara:strand:+ start:435 stop:1934 length:1500 start_codon:yes stop_codon:yes gene_type:complete
MTRVPDNYEQCPPKADAMIHSLRAFGYDLSMAIADLIDNSIYAGASNIRIEYAWNDGQPWIRIMDDGTGMTEEYLVEAMRLGTRSPLEKRDPKDLGRFGLGLKTASFSQCKLLTVHTMTTDKNISTRFWDLDQVQKSRSWFLGKIPPRKTKELLSGVNDLKHGTVVLWQNIDRIYERLGTDTYNAEEAFLDKFLVVKEYLEMVFHQYLEERSRKLSIFVGVARCEPWDPYLRKNNFTQKLSSEKYEESKISVIPYILPHVSKRSEAENTNGSGPKGWNSQQGFYVYRNRRMIVSGGYLDFNLKAEEHCKLARIKVDLTNDMDHEWAIDVRKAVAIPPDRLRAELVRIARATRQKAAEVYRARTGAIRRRSILRQTDDVWIKKKVGEKITYKINQENVVLKMILNEFSPKKGWTKKLFHVIESTVPHRLIIMDGLEHEDCHADLPADLKTPPKELIDICFELYGKYRRDGKTHEQSVDIICGMDIYSTHPAYRAFLDDHV